MRISFVSGDLGKLQMQFNIQMRDFLEEQTVKTLQMILMVCGVCLFAGLCAEYSRAEEADEKVRSATLKMLKAIERNDYEAFVGEGTNAFKAEIKKQMFKDFSAQVAKRLKGGYGLSYFGSMNKQGEKLHLSKLVFKDGGDDNLVTITLQDDKISGFLIN